MGGCLLSKLGEAYKEAVLQGAMCSIWFQGVKITPEQGQDTRFCRLPSEACLGTRTGRVSASCPIAPGSLALQQLQALGTKQTLQTQWALLSFQRIWVKTLKYHPPKKTDAFSLKEGAKLWPIFVQGVDCMYSVLVTNSISCINRQN